MQVVLHPQHLDVGPQRHFPQAVGVEIELILDLHNGSKTAMSTLPGEGCGNEGCGNEGFLPKASFPSLHSKKRFMMRKRTKGPGATCFARIQILLALQKHSRMGSKNQHLSEVS
jgi:hypothetical protein